MRGGFYFSQLVVRWFAGASGSVAGLRIIHVDGLSPFRALPVHGFGN